MYQYEVVEFSRTFETDEDVEVVAAQMSAQGSQESNINATNFALVRREIDEEYDCGAELDGGGVCGRTVGGPDETCWQH